MTNYVTNVNGKPPQASSSGPNRVERKPPSENTGAPQGHLFLDVGENLRSVCFVLFFFNCRVFLIHVVIQSLAPASSTGSLERSQARGVAAVLGEVGDSVPLDLAGNPEQTGFNRRRGSHSPNEGSWGLELCTESSFLPLK